MFNKEFFDKHFKLHGKLVMYTQDNIKMTITPEYHFRIEGGCNNFTLHDTKDLAEFANKYRFSIKPNKEEM